MRDYKTETEYAEIGVEFDEHNDVWFSVRITAKNNDTTIEQFYRTKNISVIEAIKESCDQAIVKIKEHVDQTNINKGGSRNQEWW